MAFDTGIIADDLTGGLLVASFLEGEGIECPLFTKPEALPDRLDAPAAVIARRFRLIPAAEATADFEAAAGALQAHRPRQLYYKYCATFDSTDEGNIGPCADVLARLTGVDRLGFCTGFPSRGVSVYLGHIFLHDELLSESPKRFDPITPMPDPNLVRVLGRQTRRRVGLVPHAVLATGRAAAEAHIEKLVASGVSYLIFDAIDEDDVVACARLTADWPAMTGGDTLSHVGPALRIRERRQTPPLPRMDGPGAVVAGSCGGATLEQLERFAAHRPVRHVDLLEAAADPAAAVAEALDWATSRIGDGPVAIAVSDRPDGVARTQAALGRDQAARLGETVCARIAAGLYERGVRRFIVAGGETSGAVAEALGIERLHAAAPAELGGGLCHASSPAPMSLFFKAGKMGPPDLFLRAFDMMEGKHGRN